jgi:hypothetical protein
MPQSCLSSVIPLLRLQWGSNPAQKQLDLFAGKTLYLALFFPSALPQVTHKAPIDQLNDYYKNEAKFQGEWEDK